MLIMNGIVDVQDAAWILPGSTVRCTTPADVYLLLKSSDFVAKDLAQAHELARPTNAPDAESICLEVAPDGIPQSIQGADSRGNAPTSDGTILSVAEGTAGFIQRISAPRIELVLKKWFDMPKSHEFRCFVRNGRLVGKFLHSIAGRSANFAS